MSVEHRLNGRSASLSDVGLERQVNEDAFLERPLPEGGLWVVADGMGGHRAGDIASRMVVDALRDVRQPDNLSALIDDAETRLHGVNQALCRLAAQTIPAQAIGTTVAALLRCRGQAACLWAGDSRIYRFRDGVLSRLTRDHSAVEEMIAEQRLRREEAANHPEANIITRAVGADDELCLDVRFVELCSLDRYLLCSDGLYNEVDESRICAVLSNGNPLEAAQTLIGLALDHGARDNVTVIVVDFEDQSL